MPRRAPFSLLLLLLWIVGPASAQSAPKGSTTTLFVTTRLIYVDVIVRDGNGHVASGLTQADFIVKEDGRPRPIVYFQDSATALGTAGNSPAALHPRPAKTAASEFSNVPAAAVADPAVDLILLDLLNTPGNDQLYAIKQLILFCRKLPPGHRMALFLLTDRLHMLQGFTGSSEELTAAANRLSARDLGFTRSESERMQAADLLANFGQAIGRDPGGAVAHMTAEIENEDAQNLAARARTTADAFAQIARAAAGFSGRKNLLWLAEVFPVGVGAQLQVDRSFQAVELLDTTNQIASLQMAVYPISLAGLQGEGINAAASGAGEAALMGGSMLGDTLRNQFNARNAARYAMDDLARATGGEAFHGTNDIAGALARSVADGSHFYTLAYRSQNTKQDGHFREIGVALARHGYQLSYRQGYFATPQADGTRNVDVELAAALQPSSLDSSLLRLRANVLAVPTRPTVAVDVTLDATDLSYRLDAAGHRHTQLLVRLIAAPTAADKSKAGIPPQTGGVLNLDLDPAQYALLVKDGLRFREQIALPPGSCQLRLGVAETTSHRIGTLALPITVP